MVTAHAYFSKDNLEVSFLAFVFFYVFLDICILILRWIVAIGDDQPSRYGQDGGTFDSLGHGSEERGKIAHIRIS